MREVPSGISELADRLVGIETDTRTLLKKLYEFVLEHRRDETPTTGKAIEQLLDEYGRTGYFYGNCKEGRDFYAALCNSKGFSTKKVYGKSLLSGGHVWVDVFVPLDDGYKLLPVDPTSGHFGDFSTQNHLFLEDVPQINIRLFQIGLDYLKGRDYKDYRLKLVIGPKD